MGNNHQFWKTYASQWRRYTYTHIAPYKDSTLPSVSKVQVYRIYECTNQVLLLVPPSRLIGVICGKELAPQIRWYY